MVTGTQRPYLYGCEARIETALMEQRYKSFEQKKPKIYRFFTEPTTAEKKLKVIELHNNNVPNEYIAAELALSHTTVMKVVKEYRDQDIHA
jgi:hypothetical protein